MKIPFFIIQGNGLEDRLDFGIEEITFAQIAEQQTIEDMWNCLSEDQQRAMLNKMLDEFLDQEDNCAIMIKKIYRCLEKRINN